MGGKGKFTLTKLVFLLRITVHCLSIESLMDLILTHAHILLSILAPESLCHWDSADGKWNKEMSVKWKQKCSKENWPQTKSLQHPSKLGQDLCKLGCSQAYQCSASVSQMLAFQISITSSLPLTYFWTGLSLNSISHPLFGDENRGQNMMWSLSLKFLQGLTKFSILKVLPNVQRKLRKSSQVLLELQLGLDWPA